MRSLLTPLCLLPFALVAWPASAQVLEERIDTLQEAGAERLSVDGSFESAWYEYDNLDLRALDETSDQAMLDSDDRNGFAFTGARLGLRYQVEDHTALAVSVSHQGLWGNDQLGGTNAYGGWIYFSGLYVEYTPKLGGFAPVFRVGRQSYSIGGLGGGPDYVLSDVLDMVRVDVPLGDVAHLELVPINVVGLSGEAGDANFVDYIGRSSTTTFGFRGDHMTRRFGGVFALDAVDRLDVRLYGFYTDIGALGSGSDISYEGLLGNFSDNDWTANVGVRGSYAIGPVTPFVSVDYSLGIDRKEEVARDADARGWALTAGVHVDTRDGEAGAVESRGVLADALVFDTLGATYWNDGLLLSHGFVSMKGRQVGGTLTNDFLGWHPTPYVDMFGVTHEAHDPDRKAGTRTLHARAGYDGGRWVVEGAIWRLQDRGYTELNLNNLETLEPPFGYSREEFAAQERLGLVLGHEVDLDLAVALTDHLEIVGNGAYFLPGPFYDIEISRIAGDQLGGDPVPAWAVSAGTRLAF